MQAAGQVELNAESNKMLVLCQRLRKENDAKAQDIEEKKFAMEDAEKRLVQAMTLSQVDNAKISKLKVETGKQLQIIFSLYIWLLAQF